MSDIVVVPEPSTYASIMGGCLLGAGALRRMRHTTKLPTDSLS
ncbi:MAG: PEP-CTERM sorting domain-containing protein [Verrucomicrobia bacterium]|nr:PEP-CTERM sorting domain-containing protein [Verrucomicrobiota bacterium]